MGKTRYRSYASATADGLRGLLLSGETMDSPRVVKAAGWLRKFRWKIEGAADAPADLSYYTARSIGRCARLGAEVAGIPVEALAECQEEDGSWCNVAGEMREDCPVVATALVVESLCERHYG